MKIIVINLISSDDRKKIIAKKLDILGLDYEFIEAVDGSKLSEEDIMRLCNRKWIKRHIGRHLYIGEIGCSLSHLKVYKKILDENLPFALILEDDVILNHSVISGIKSIERNICSTDRMICLLSDGAGANLGKASCILDEHNSMARITSAAYSAYAYVITHEAAKILHGALFPVVQVSDDWGWISRHTGIELYATQPPIASHLEENKSKSTIVSNGEVRRENLAGRWRRWGWWKDKLYRKWWGTVDRLGLGYFFWRNW